jgi:hypothetical protein
VRGGLPFVLNNDTMEWNRIDAIDGITMLHRAIELDGDILFSEPESIVEAYRTECASRSCVSKHASFEDSLSMGRKLRLCGYRQLKKVVDLKAANKAVICNLDQDPFHHPMASSLLPCQLRGCSLWSETRGRLLTGLGHLAAQLIPITKEMAVGAGIPFPFFDTTCVSPAALNRMSGNGQNMVFIGSFVGCTLACVRRKTHWPVLLVPLELHDNPDGSIDGTPAAHRVRRGFSPDSDLDPEE